MKGATFRLWTKATVAVPFASMPMLASKTDPYAGSEMTVSVGDPVRGRTCARSSLTHEPLSCLYSNVTVPSGATARCG